MPITLAPALRARSISSRVCVSDQHGHVQLVRQVEQVFELGVVQCGDDEQHQIGTVGAGLEDLVVGDDEVLAQHRNMHGGANLVEIIKAAEESAAFGEHGDGACAALPYSRASAAGSGMSERWPLDGDARLISAITGMPSARLSHRVASIGAGAASAAFFTSSRDTVSSRVCWSSSAPATNSSKTDMVLPLLVCDHASL